MVTFDSTDFDSASSEEGVVHENTTNTDHTDASELKQGYSAASPLSSTDLVAYLPLHEDSGTTAHDVSGTGNDGTINGPTLGVSGLLGTTAYSFDGTDDEIVVSDDATIEADSPISWSFWINTTDTSGNLAVLSKGTGAQHYEMGWHDGANGWRVKIDGGVGEDLKVDYANTSVFDGNWHFVCVTFPAGGDIIYYEDGTQEASGTLNTSFTTTDDLTIMRTDRNGANQSGKIWDLRIYSKVLSSSEVQTLYNAVNTAGLLQTQFKTV